MNDGGPAYPAHQNKEDAQLGLSIRDHIAGCVLEGLVIRGTMGTAKELAKMAYGLADEMLIERKRGLH